MKTPIQKLALYTTLYPAAKPFLSAWMESVLRQSNGDFQMWIGLDGMSESEAIAALGHDPHATWVRAHESDSPALVRQRAWMRIAECCDAVVMVDSDDVLWPARLANARALLGESDIAGCALRLVDRDGHSLGARFPMPSLPLPEHVFPRSNIFGLSNSAYRSDLLRRCLPIPANVELVDWFLATRAWLLGARVALDETIGMDYRQHGANMVRVLPPFGREQIVRDTVRVQHHFATLLDSPPEGVIETRLAHLRQIADEVESFRTRVILRSAVLDQYINEINALDLEPLWWSWVAQPSLNRFWA